LTRAVHQRPTKRVAATPPPARAGSRRAWSRGRRPCRRAGGQARRGLSSGKVTPDRDHSDLSTGGAVPCACPPGGVPFPTKDDGTIGPGASASWSALCPSSVSAPCPSR
jgi:hypothetical protein